MSVDDEEIDRMRLESSWAGKAASLEDFEYKLKRMAGEAYAAGHDDMAKMLRKIALLAGKDALDHRKEQKKYEYRHSGGL